MIDYRAVLEDARRRILEIERELEHLIKLVEHADALASLAGPVDHATPLRVTVSKKPSQAMMPTREAAAKALAERGEPMPTRELLHFVLSQGVEVGGKDQVATLSARLSNAPEFRNRRGVGWWFADRPLPSAFSALDEAEGQSVEGQPPASDDNSSGGTSNAAALDNPAFG